MSKRSLQDSVMCRIATTHAHRQYKRFLRVAKRAGATQERVLLAKIKRNRNSAYGEDHDFASIRTYQDFIERVPVQTYDDLRPYVQRVMAGEVRAMFGRRQRVLMFAMTSGSTDTPKYVPVTQSFLDEYRRGWNAFGVKALLDHPDAILRHILQVTSPLDERRTHFGIPCGSISGLLSATQKRLVRKYYVTPQQTAYIGDADARYYTIMRYAVPRDVGWLVTASPATQLKLARAVERHGERIIRDIHDGTLRPPGEIPGQVLRDLMRNRSPDPATANRLSRLADHYGALFPKHYWSLSFLANWTGGTMGLHLRDFPKYFGDAPIRDIGLLATEGRVSITIEDGTPAGPLDAGGSFFEFIEGDDDSADPHSVFRCQDVVPGKEYRILLTTSAGFYRYDIGDRVRVHRMLGQAPIVEFLHRGRHTASMTGEKLTEWQVTHALDKCCQGLGFSLTDFVLAPCWGDPPYYRLHLDGSIKCYDRLASRLDQELSHINVEYASKRRSGRLGPIIVNVLPDGTLAHDDSVRQLRHGGSNEQFKHRYLMSEPGEDDAHVSAGIQDVPSVASPAT